ncbi:MAG TPA: glycosyltransferase family 4 protein [Pseudomonadales bacterium]|nr:glycosyltransferase family 4 protein [Pseudomonadales bacterium]HNC76317.1 glycosyltransferase family 4 protein [Pseudomonadales bacterium]HND26804.1 glycosyltransferase family 4 protein [Pseudomonadales bacterium]
MKKSVGNLDQYAPIVAAVPSGSGAAVVHRMIEDNTPSYKVKTYPPTWEYCPFKLRQLREPTAALVHAPPDHAIFVCPRRTPLVITFHNYVLDPAMRAHGSLAQRLHYAGDLRLLTRLALRQAVAVTAVSDFTAQLVRDDMRFAGTIAVIPNGVDTQRFHPAEEAREGGPLRVLFSGNLTRRKGAQLLPEIARLAGPDVAIHYTAGARAELTDPGWAGLHPVGRVPHHDMPTLYRQFEVLLLPTVREGMSLALLEAMASGLAVVASNASSNPELIAEGVGGHLCPVAEAEAYAAALRSLASSRAKVRAMGQENRRLVEQQHSVGRMVGAYQALFAEVLAI